MPRGRIWKQEELDYLERSVGSIKIATMANRLGRTESAVIARMEQMGIGKTKYESGRLTANELAKALKVDSHTPIRWIKDKGLKAIYKATRGTYKFWLIDIHDFWKWAEKNKELINFSKLEKYDLLPQPDWVELERKRDYHTIPKKQGAKWTEQEDSELIKMVKNDYKTKAIADRLKRSEKAIVRRISRLRESGVIPKKKISLRWSEEELRILSELELKGLSDEEIAYELGREADHIQDKRRRLGYKKPYKVRKYGNVM